MKTIGLIGGMSWESTLVYYKLINEMVKDRMGGFHSAKCFLYSVDFAEIESLQHADKWSALDAHMASAAKKLEDAGADLLVLCTNTMHVCSNAITENISIPFLHIAEATGEEIEKQHIKKVGLLGTKFTMEKDFYKEVLSGKYGIEVIIPDAKERDMVHRVIYDELVQGKIREDSKEAFKEVIRNFETRGAAGVVLGCTEIPMLISAVDVPVKVFDTTRIHAEKAVEIALNLT